MTRQINSIGHNYLRGNDNEVPTKVVLDAEDNMIHVGRTSSPNLFLQANITYQGKQDGFIYKSDPLGNILWASYIGGTQSDEVVDVAIDTQNNIFVLGHTTSPEFLPAPTIGSTIRDPVEKPDMFLIKYLPNGKLNWSRYIGSWESEFATNIQLDELGNIFIGGFTDSSDKGRFKAINNYMGEMDALVGKIDPNGAFVWSRYMGGTDRDIIHDIALVPENGDIIVAGYTNSSDFSIINGTGTLSGHRDVFVSRLDSEGEIQWSDIVSINTHGNASSEFEDSIGIAYHDNKIYLSTWTDMNYGTMGDKNAILISMDNEGQILWSEQLNGSGDERFTSIQVDQDRIWLTGFTNSFDFETKNPLFSSYQDYGDIFLASYSIDRELKMSTYLGGSYLDFSTGILVKSTGICIYGITQSSDFAGHNQQIKGLDDMFVITISFSCLESSLNIPNVLRIIIESLSIFEWLMIMAAIIFVNTVISYYRKTRILEFLLMAGVFASLALSSLIQLVGFIFPRIDEISILLRQPISSLSITWVLILLHAYRIKWEMPPLYHTGTASTLLALKLLSPALNLDYDPAQTATIKVIGFLLFDIYAIGVLFYAYLTVDLANPTKRLVKAYRLWIVTWALFLVGYIFLITMTGTQIFLISLNQAGGDVEGALILYRTLTAIFASGAFTFLVFLLIGYISIAFPEALLLSQVQITNALKLYERIQKREIPNLGDYLRSARGSLNN